MMGPSHALSGAAVWLAGSWALEQFARLRPVAAGVAVGTAVCAGGALLPDLDLSGRVTRNQGGATVARTFGGVSLFVAEVVEKFSLGVYDVTKLSQRPAPQQRAPHAHPHHPVHRAASAWAPGAVRRATASGRSSASCSS